MQLRLLLLLGQTHSWIERLERGQRRHHRSLRQGLRLRQFALRQSKRKLSQGLNLQDLPLLSKISSFLWTKSLGEGQILQSRLRCRNLNLCLQVTRKVSLSCIWLGIDLLSTNESVDITQVQESFTLTIALGCLNGTGRQRKPWVQIRFLALLRW